MNERLRKVQEQITEQSVRTSRALSPERLELYHVLLELSEVIRELDERISQGEEKGN